MTTHARSDERLARRYGTRPSVERDAGDGARISRVGSRLGRGGFGRGAWIGSAAVAVVITGIVIALSVTGDDDVASAQAVSYRVASDSLTVVQLAVTRPDPSIAVSCAAEAIDASLAQVGAGMAEIGPSSAHTVTIDIEVITYARAEQGRALENGCFALEP